MLVIDANGRLKTPDGVPLDDYVWRRQYRVGADGTSRLAFSMMGVTRESYMGTPEPNPRGPLRVMFVPPDGVFVPSSRLVALRPCCEHISVTLSRGYHASEDVNPVAADPSRMSYEIDAIAAVICEPASPAAPAPSPLEAVAAARIVAGSILTIDDSTCLVRLAIGGEHPIGVATAAPDSDGNVEAFLSSGETVRLQSRQAIVVEHGERLPTVPAEQWLIRERMREAMRAARPTSKPGNPFGGPAVPSDPEVGDFRIAEEDELLG
jgi:hypothetical protein